MTNTSEKYAPRDTALVCYVRVTVSVPTTTQDDMAKRKKLVEEAREKAEQVVLNWLNEDAAGAGA